jgi:hypothetical protein
VTGTTILARSVATQELIEFNRVTDVAAQLWHSDKYEYVINSTATLPGDIREIMLSLDRLFREFEYKRAEDPNYEPSWDKPLLNDDQRRGLLFVSYFYEAHPLPA